MSAELQTTDSIASNEELWPLPLTPFEQYYLLDDRSDYPMTFPVDLYIQGIPHRSEFDKAFDMAVAVHPLLRARVEKRPEGYVWLPENSAVRAQWDVDDIEAVDPLIDIRTSSKPKILIQTDNDRNQTRVRLLLHHACCDGMGVAQFVEDVMIAYHRLVTGDESIRSRQYDSQRLKMRGDYGLTAAGYRRNLPDDLRVARACLSLAWTQPRLLASGRGGDATRYAFANQVLPPNQESRLRKLARSSGATLNDLLLRDMFLTTRDWNQSMNVVGRGPIRITVPTSLRLHSDHYMPATNCLSFAFLSHHENQLDAPSELLESIRDRMNLIKEHRLGLYFAGGLKFLRQIGVLRWTLSGKRSFSTLVLSNLGRVLGRCPLPRDGARRISGNLIFERFDAVPPIRAGTRASLGIVKYAGKTSISLRCDPAFFSIEDTEELLRAYCRRLAKSAESV